MTKRINKQYPDDFKQEAVALVLEQNYTIVQAAASLGITDKILYNWVAKQKKLTQGDALSVDERTELMLLRKENKRLLMEREILKKASAFFAKEMK
ncbi:transposase [Shewanella sp. A14]